MTSQTLKCPRCEYENIVLTCGFCLQCGQDMTTEEIRMATTATDNPSTHVAQTGAPAFDELVQSAAKDIDAPCEKTKSGWKLTLELAENRQQSVYVMESDTPGIVSFLSICGSASEANAMALLDWNGRLTECAFAIRKIAGNKMFVLTSNWPLVALDVATTVRRIQIVAERADRVEAKLGQGVDRY